MFIFSLFVPSSSLAQADSSSPVDACKYDIATGLAQQQRIYRSVLFGQKKAADQPVNAIDYDREAKVFIKTEDDRWVGSDGEILKDKLMDERADIADRRGIFETRQVLTSELIPALTQSYRALTCRALSVCANSQLSPEEAAAIQINKAPLAKGIGPIQIPGCDEIDLHFLPTCLPINSAPDLAITKTYCESMADQMLNREADLLKLAVTYDAAYRTLLQFAGNFDQFIASFRGDLLSPIEQATAVVTQLSRIPCFLAECNE